MKKSIFGRLVLSSFAIVAMVAVVSMIYFVTFMENYAIEEKSNLLVENVDELEKATYFALTNRSDITDIMFQNLIDAISSNTHSSITVFDSNGFVIATSGRNVDQNSFESVSERITKPVLSGIKVESARIYQDENGDKILTVGVPLSNEGEIFGGVMFNQLVPEIKSMYEYLSNRMLAMIIVAMVMAALFFYLMSLTITNPIKRISAAVTEFAKGNFKKRVEYSSDNELGELADHINNMASALDNLEDSRNSFISDVSHELRTPLTTITGFVEGILDGTVPEENREEYLGVVLSESKRLSRLITNLLQVTRMENGETKLERTDFDINELVRITLLKFEMMITPKNIDVSLNIKEGKLKVNADKDNINQVLVNLFNNAVKFTPDNGNISIDIEEKRDKVWISITNSGHGIEPDQIEHIWDRFYKTDKSRSRERTGVGLGLYIVKQILNMHKEQITAESVVDNYTRFKFSLSKSKQNGTENEDK